MTQHSEIYAPEECTINFKLLEEAQKALGWNHEITGREANIAEGTVKNVVTGRTRNPGSETLKKICDALGVPIEEVLRPKKKEIENKGVKIDDAAIIALKEIYELQVASMKETNEAHIANIRTHYEQHHQDLVENFEKRLADKRELNDTLNEQIKDLKRANFIKNLLLSLSAAIFVVLFIMEIMHPEHGWLRY